MGHNGISIETINISVMVSVRFLLLFFQQIFVRCNVMWNPGIMNYDYFILYIFNSKTDLFQCFNANVCINTSSKFVKTRSAQVATEGAV